MTMTGQDDYEMKLRFPTQPRQSVREKQKARLLGIVLDHIKSGVCSVSEIMAAMHIKENKAQRLVNELLRTGKITATARPKSGPRYALAGKGPAIGGVEITFYAIKRALDAQNEPIAINELEKLVDIGRSSLESALDIMVKNGELKLTTKTIMIPREVNAWVISAKTKKAIASPDAMKFCTKCKMSKPIDDFARNQSMSDGYLNQCKKCRKQQVKKNDPV